MGKIISFADKFEKLQEAQEKTELMDFFRKEILPHLSDQNKIKLINAIDNNDHETYLSITNPILMRNGIREMNLK